MCTAVALALVLPACADSEFVAECGSPPPESPGVSAWFVAGGGSIWHSNDGGASRKRQLEGAPRTLIDVTFADSLHGWAVGVKGCVLATADGGLTLAASGRSSWLGDGPARGIATVLRSLPAVR